MLSTVKEMDLYDDVSNPLDGVEEIMLNNDWAFDRRNEDEMTVHVSGKYGAYKMAFIWQENHSALQFCCAPDLSISPNRMIEATQVINKINASLWLGHFDVRSDDLDATAFIPCFRYTSLFRGVTDNSGVGHMEDLIDIALNECERFYMSFDLLSKATPSTAKDMSLALMDVAGIS